MLILSCLALLTNIGCFAHDSEATDGNRKDILNVDTYEWMAISPDHTLAATPRMMGWPMVAVTTHSLPEEGPEKEVPQLVATRLRKTPTPHHRRAEAEDSEHLLQAIWNRPAYRNDRFDLKKTSGEHPCFAGFAHMVNHTGRCNGWVREYPPVGESVVFLNTGVSVMRHFTLKAFVAGSINVWLEEGTTVAHKDIAIKAAKIYTNEYGIKELRPSTDSASWMEHECKVMGPMPFMYTCSNRINILVQECHQENAWVMPADYLQNYPMPANEHSKPNHDIIFYMCKELLDRNPNPYAAANTFAHELAHVIQGGFGFSSNTMTEGGATWLEGALLKLPPRPMVYAWGFQDWNRINAAHIYANTKELNARKFYQIHAMLLTYLSQPELLGDQATSALQNYQTFDFDNVPWGRSSYDYFLQHIEGGMPSELLPITINVTDTRNAFATTLLNYRVAIASQCISDATLRPSEAKYLMPQHLRERPFWDCTSYPTYWSSTGNFVNDTSAEIHYGGAAIYRLAFPQNATIFIAADADPRIRTKVLAAGEAGGPGAEVRELRPGESSNFEGTRELFVVQVNVDPEGETLAPSDRPPLWRRSSYRCSSPCHGEAWRASAGQDLYPPNQLVALQTPLVQVPSQVDGDASLTFTAMWDLEAASVGGTIGEGCATKGFDGVQVRILVEGHALQDKAITVLSPDGGYGRGLGGEMALSAFEPLYSDSSPCLDFQGWTGNSGNFTWKNQTFSLVQFAGQSIRIELLFASDEAVGGEGFWVDEIQVHAGSVLLFDDDFEAMSEQLYYFTPAAGDRGTYDGVPVIAGLPAGYTFDRNLDKADRTRSATWSAHWASPSVGSEASLRRAYLGWSYAAPITSTKTLRLHPNEEVCMRLRAPFAGSVRVATLFTLVDKIGVSSVSLAFRSVSEPHELLEDTALQLSSSVGVEDPGVHRFSLIGRVPVFNQGDDFLMCAGIGSVKELPADDVKSLPFLHLPLTHAVATSQAGEPGATFLITPTDSHKASNFQTTGLDPFQGHTFVLRSEFVEVLTVPQADELKGVAAARGLGFLSSR